MKWVLAGKVTFKPELQTINLADRGTGKNNNEFLNEQLKTWSNMYTGWLSDNASVINGQLGPGEKKET